jgi:hypothetical protein
MGLNGLHEYIQIIRLRVVVTISNNYVPYRLRDNVEGRWSRIRTHGFSTTT